MNRLVAPQCDFCFCDLKPRFYNSSICEKCTASPLAVDAITSLARYPHCVNCDRLLCPFHLSSQYLSQELCKTCYGVTIRRAMVYNYNYDSSDDDSFPLPWPTRFVGREGEGEDNDEDDDEETVDYPEDEEMEDEDDEDDEDEEMRDAEEEEEEESESEFVRHRRRDREQEHDDNGGSGDLNTETGGGNGGVDRFYTVVDNVGAENTSVCPICLESLRADGSDFAAGLNVALNCHATHLFHLGCATTWLIKNAVCPLCCKKLDS